MLDLTRHFEGSPLLKHYVSKCRALSEHTRYGTVVVNFVSPDEHTHETVQSLFGLPKIQDAITRSLGTNKFALRFILRKDKEKDEGQQIWK